MSSKKVTSVRGVALSVVLCLAVLLVLIGFFLLFFGTANACRLLNAVTTDPLTDLDHPTNSSQFHGNGTLLIQDLNTPTDDAIVPKITTKRPPEKGHQDLSTPQYGSSTGSSTVPKHTATTSLPRLRAHTSTSTTTAPITFRSETNPPKSLSSDEQYDTKWDEFSFSVADLIHEDKDDTSLTTATKSLPIPDTTTALTTSTGAATSSRSTEKPVDLFRTKQPIPVRVNVAQLGRITNKFVSEVVPKRGTTSASSSTHSTTSVGTEHRSASVTSGTRSTEKATLITTSPSASSSHSTRTMTTSRNKPAVPTTTAHPRQLSHWSFTRARPLQTSGTMHSKPNWSRESVTRPETSRLPDSRGWVTHAPTERRRPYPENWEQSTPPVRTASNQQGPNWRWNPPQHPQTITPSESRRVSSPFQQLKVRLSSPIDLSDKSRQSHGDNDAIMRPSPVLKSAHPSTPHSNSPPVIPPRRESDSFGRSWTSSQKHSTDDGRKPIHHARPQQKQVDGGVTSKQFDTRRPHSEVAGSMSNVKEGSQSNPHRHRMHHHHNHQHHHSITQPSVPADDKHSPPLNAYPDGSFLITNARDIEDNLIPPAGKTESEPERDLNQKIKPPLTIPLTQAEKHSTIKTNDPRSQPAKVIVNGRLKPSSGGLQPVNVITPEPIGLNIDPRKLDVTLKHNKVEHAHRHEQHDHFDRSSPVVVTALLDIGRGKWPKYTRTYEQYMSYLENLLSLRNRMVIFTDHRGAEFVRGKRHHANTQVFEISMRDLPMYRYRDEMQQLLAFEKRDWKFDEKMREKPEATSADYDVLVNSKPYFLSNATQSSRFRANALYYVWIDAGYGHGDKRVIPFRCHWQPTFPNGVMTVIQLTPEHDKISRYSINDLYRVDWSVVSGGFLAGDVSTINRFYRFYYKTFLDLLDARKVDDDQTVLTMMIKNYASLFKLIHSHGDWFALFRLFPCSR